MLLDTSCFALKQNLTSLDLDRLVPVPVDLSKVSDVVKHVVKKAVSGKLVEKVCNIDTSGFVLKTKYGTDKTELENEISVTKGLFKKTDYNTKIPEIKGKRTPIIGLATNAALTAVENKIPDVSSLVKKSRLSGKIY